MLRWDTGAKIKSVARQGLKVNTRGKARQIIQTPRQKSASLKRCKSLAILEETSGTVSFLRETNRSIFKTHEHTAYLSEYSRLVTHVLKVRQI